MRAAGETTGLVLVLDDFADYAAATGDIPRSLRLFGAGRALEDATGTGLAAATEAVMRRDAIARLCRRRTPIASSTKAGR